MNFRLRTIAACERSIRDEQFAREGFDDADAYGRHKATPAQKAAADAEWEAMDWRGNLPDGWVNPVSTLVENG